MMLFELIQVAIGKRTSLLHNPSDKEWSRLYIDAMKQSVAGLAFEGIQKLPKEQCPPQKLLFQWLAISEQIKQQNLLANKRSMEVTKVLADAGFRSCILKGQGNAQMYPNSLVRMPGDIDIWICGCTGCLDITQKVLREEINKFVRKRCPNAFEQKHHIDFPLFNDIEVEVHYTPGLLLSPKCNRRFQKWCGEQKDDVRCVKLDADNVFYVPSEEFNVIYQMAHIMIHFFIEGIGLRHFIDYYYVLQHADHDNNSNANYEKLFKQFGLLRFARGVMWVEKKCLGLEEELLLLEPDERAGSMIMKEMLEGGNFGHYDERYKTRKRGYFARGITDVSRLLKLATAFPSESLWKIIRKIENQRWKLKRIF